VSLGTFAGAAYAHRVVNGVRIGVRLGWRGGDLGGWLADGAAYDAAGADALWVDAAGDLDPLVLAGALAAVTYRSLLVAPAMAAADAGRIRERDRAIETVTRLSQGRLRIAGAFEDPDRRWVDTVLPDGRAAWAATLAEAAEYGHYGLVIPADARLVDLLRNPGQPDSRRDLDLSVG
jgi:hypothetical protein